MNHLAAEEEGVSGLHLCGDRVLRRAVVLEAGPLVASRDDTRRTGFLGEIIEGDQEIDARFGPVGPDRREDGILHLVTVQFLGLVPRTDLDDLSRVQPICAGIFGEDLGAELVDEVPVEKFLAEAGTVGDKIGESFGVGAVEFFGPFVVVLGAWIHLGEDRVDVLVELLDLLRC